MNRSYATAFLAGMTSLALELLLVRLLAFFLTSTADYLAIPLTLLGLALGSMVAHFAYRGPLDRLVSRASAAALPVLVVSLVALFATFNLFFFQVHVSLSAIGPDALRLIVYSAVLLPPFAVFGALFAALFGGNTENLGRLYAADLAGAATGCLVAPVLLTVSGLPLAIVGVLTGALLLLLVDAQRSRWAQIGGCALFAAVLLGIATGVLFHERPNPVTLTRSRLGRGDARAGVVEVGVRWNELARAALIKVKRVPDPAYFIIQDNGLSNVSLTAWPPSDADAAKGLYALPWKLGRDPKKILVMFAGAGRDMMAFDKLSGGSADITGVELNPAVEALALRVPALKVGEFMQRPNVHMVVQEGRDFLDHDKGIYDLIYVANNGAVFASRTGHTRKYLDTREAMAAYLDHLAPNGLMVFVKQPIAEKITSFQSLFSERGLGEFERAAFVIGRRTEPELQNLVVARPGIAPDYIPILEAEAREGKDLALFRGEPGEDLDSLASARVVDDNRPFTRGIDLGRLELDPRKHQHDLAYISSWVKVFTVGLFAVLSGIAGLVLLAVGRGPARVPAGWISYLFATGIGFMCVEIGLVARTELFVGNPLYAVALNLAVFLVASAGGSYVSGRRWASPLALAGVALLGIGWGVVATGLVTTYALSLPLPLKAVLVALSVGPAGAALGMFYPYAVGRLTAEGRAQAVPATYALTTLSSVLGSAFATTAMIELGFRQVIGVGAVAYLIAGGIGWWQARSYR